MILTDTYGVTDDTAPLVLVTLAEKADAVARFGLDSPGVLDEWDVKVDPDLDGWVIRWPYLRITIGDSLGDLRLAQTIAAERIRGRHHVDEVTVLARRALGWPSRGTPIIMCRFCRTSAIVTRAHVPRSPECVDARTDRLWDHAH